MRNIFGLLLCAAGLTILSCASSPSLLLSDADNSKSFSVRQGDLLKISLEAQLSTGYGWQIASLSGVEKYGEINVETQQTRIAGGKDVQHIVFKAVQPGSGFIELKYVQPWKQSDTPSKVYRISITVTEK